MGNASQRPEGDDKAAVLEKANTEGAKPEKSREDTWLGDRWNAEMDTWIHRRIDG